MEQAISGYIQADDQKKQETKGKKKIKGITARFDCALGELAQVQVKASNHSASKQQWGELSLLIPEGVEVKWDRKNKLTIRRSKQK